MQQGMGGHSSQEALWPGPFEVGGRKGLCCTQRGRAGFILSTEARACFLSNTMAGRLVPELKGAANLHNDAWIRGSPWPNIEDTGGLQKNGRLVSASEAAFTEGIGQNCLVLVRR